MTDRTLYERMREAADVLDEASVEAKGRGVYAPTDIWNAKGLRNRADEWERENAEKAAATAAYDAEVEELARALYGQHRGTSAGWPIEDAQIAYVYRERARDLIAAGWRKQDPT